MKKGFTLPELLISLVILTTLFAITTITLLRSQRVSVQGAQVDTLLADLRDQQTKAMVSPTMGGADTYDYGIYLTETSYTLFRGSAYDPNEPTNFVVALEPSLRISQNTFPGSLIVFGKGSGEIVGFTQGSNTFVVDDPTNSRTITLTLNKYGIPLE
ncbi:type II secretion system protein [Candidatus Woesebacteria bacterium]|nr:type II secretion system protein [Candidatus Woesebacteria bacterium]